MALTSLQPGLYRHYKGGLYSVMGIARHSETAEWLVVYQPQYGERGLWVRPLDMFTEQVMIEGKPVPRFSYVGADDTDPTRESPAQT